MSTNHRILRTFNFAVEVIEDILKQGPNHQTTLIVCSRQDEFRNQILASLETAQDEPNPNTGPRTAIAATTIPSTTDEIPPSQEDIEHDAEVTDPSDKHLQRRRSLLNPTLHQLATSRNVQVIFCPTITTFRAYLSVFQPGQYGPAMADGEVTNPAKLIVMDLIALHHGTSEFTLQGLSRTLARVASTAWFYGLQLDLVETRDCFDLGNPNRGSELWEAKVPLLSGSVKISAAGAGWAGRTIEISSFARRWFSFE